MNKCDVSTHESARHSFTVYDFPTKLSILGSNDLEAFLLSQYTFGPQKQGRLKRIQRDNNTPKDEN